MNFIVLIDICSALGFAVAFFALFFLRREHLFYQTRFLLYILVGLYFFVGITNILEHAGITSLFDPYEEYLEILFMPFFLFFMYTLIAKLDLQKQQEGEFALKHALNKAESEQKKSTAILAAIGDGISIQDRDLTILYQNDVHKKMLGDQVGNFCFQAYGQNNEPCHGCPVVASFHDGKVHRKERKAETQKGTRFVEITASPLADHNGEIYAGIEVVRDITNRKRMTEEIIRAQKLDSIGLLAGGIAHDFNNLLTSLLGNVSLAKTYASENEKVTAKLEKAEMASLRAKDLTQQLLTFSRGGAPVKKVMNVNALVRDSTNFSLRGANVKSNFALCENLWRLEVDPGQLSQVVNNLVINADQAMPDGGVLSVSTDNIELSADNPMLLPPGKYVRITFADQGQGISADDLSRIFDPFFTTKHDGSGLGLTTAFSIIKNHGGHISVESSPGDGTTFFIYLPATEIQAEPLGPKDDIIFTGKGKILVMDDDESIRIMAQEMLTHLGYSVTLTTRGEEALDAYLSEMAEHNPFDAVILDLTVAGGMGGKETGQRILEANPSARIVVSSGYANDQVMANYGDYGFSGIIPKPYKINELSKILHSVLGTHENAVEAGNGG